MVLIGEKLNKIAVIITTFLRDELLQKTVNRLIENWNEQYVVFIGNQSYQTEEEKLKGFSDFCLNLDDPTHLTDNKIQHYSLPYDCGLSYARNFLVEKANESGCDYILLMADSLQVSKIYDFSNIIGFLEEDNNRGIVGLDIQDRCAWEHDLSLIEGESFYLSIPKREPIKYKELSFQPVDICRNFFLAKTKVLLESKWDNELKVTEHEDFFYRLKINTNYKVYFNNSIKCIYIKDKPSEYNKKRRRIYTEFKRKLLNKYNIKNWMKVERR